ncbi:MAG: glycoside hydrolase family 25 protein [Coriobacteriia bacterium]|nr:glycoside hydrolase family 25 protein [Coriobacteriia bacterium]
MLACAAALYAALSLCACAPGSTSSWSPPYLNWDNFTIENDRYAYDGEEGHFTKTGVDVSDNQGWIDWYAVANDGIDFALIRCGFRGTSEGGLYPDDYFEYNLASAKEVGLDCGVYFFSQAVTEEEAREEARYVLELLGGVQLEYPVAFDFERQAEGIDSRVDTLTSDEATAIAQAFCEVIEGAGYRVMLYGNSYDLAWFNMDALPDYAIWYAEYGALPSCRSPYLFWQYSNNGRVRGIDAAVDMNLALV